MTKKQIILNIFEEAEWNKGHDGRRTKIITKEDFTRHGLYGDIENARQHCDVIYARKIIQSMGHRVIVGGAMYIWEGKQI